MRRRRGRPAWRRCRRSRSGGRSRSPRSCSLPAFWAMLIGLVSVGVRRRRRRRRTRRPFIAFGLALIPFVFLVLAFVSGHPTRARRGGQGDGPVPARRHPVSALAADAVTGLVAGRRGGRHRRPAGGRDVRANRAIAVAVAWSTGGADGPGRARGGVAPRAGAPFTSLGWPTTWWCSSRAYGAAPSHGPRLRSPSRVRRRAHGRCRSRTVPGLPETRRRPCPSSSRRRRVSPRRQAPHAVRSRERAYRRPRRRSAVLAAQRDQVAGQVQHRRRVGAWSATLRAGRRRTAATARRRRG